MGCNRHLVLSLRQVCLAYRADAGRVVVVLCSRDKLVSAAAWNVIGSFFPADVKACCMLCRQRPDGLCPQLV